MFRTALYFCIAVAAFVMMSASVSLASPRSGAEIFVLGEFNSGDDVTANGNAGSLNIDSGFGAGVGLGFNPNQFSNINLQLGISSNDISVHNNNTGTTTTFDKSTFAHVDINLEIYPVDGPVTPIIGGGFGIVHTRGESGGSTTSESDLAANFTVGVRMDLDSHWFTKIQYRLYVLEFDDTSDLAMFHTGAISFGYRF